MTNFFNALAAATALTLALSPHVQAQTAGQPSDPQTGPSQRVTDPVTGATVTYRTETRATLIPVTEHVLSVRTIQLSVAAEIVSCLEHNFVVWPHDDCFEARTAEGEVIVFSTIYVPPIDPSIEGYVHDGADLITVEHVRTRNDVTCHSYMEGGCQYDHYVLIED